MKKIIIYSIVFLIVLFSPIRKIVVSYWYAHHTNYELYQELLNNSNLPLSDHNLLTIGSNHSNIFQWWSMQVRLNQKSIKTVEDWADVRRTANFIEVKKREGNEWQEIVKLNCHSDHAYIFYDKILYFCDKIPIINQQGKIEWNLLKFTSVDIPVQIIQIERKIYFVNAWDSRLQWTTPGSFTSWNLAGPPLVVALELDLDTLEYKEHILKYDSQIWP